MIGPVLNLYNIGDSVQWNIYVLNRPRNIWKIMIIDRHPDLTRWVYRGPFGIGCGWARNILPYC